MPISIIRPLILSVTLGLAVVSLSIPANATSTKIAGPVGSVETPAATLESHFTPRPSVATKLDYEAWDFILAKSILYMGPSSRVHTSAQTAQLGTRFVSGHTSSFRLEGNKVLYELMSKDVKSQIRGYSDELITLGTRLDIPALPKNEQLAYWVNLHNAVLIATIAENYPGPKRKPSLIQPVKGSDATLHDSKLLTIDGYALSLRDIREKIVFPNWKNKDVPYAFHLGYLSSPSIAAYDYSAEHLRAQLTTNAEEYVNSLRGYQRGKLSAYIRDVSPWYYPGLGPELDSYFKKRMRPEVYAEYKSYGIKTSDKKDLTVADVTGGYGINGGAAKFSNIQNASGTISLGAEFEKYLTERRENIERLNNRSWYQKQFRQGTVTIEDTPSDGEPAEIE